MACRLTLRRRRYTRSPTDSRCLPHSVPCKNVFPPVGHMRRGLRSRWCHGRCRRRLRVRLARNCLRDNGSLRRTQRCRCMRVSTSWRLRSRCKYRYRTVRYRCTAHPGSVLLRGSMDRRMRRIRSDMQRTQGLRRTDRCHPDKRGRSGGVHLPDRRKATKHNRSTLRTHHQQPQHPPNPECTGRCMHRCARRSCRWRSQCKA